MSVQPLEQVPEQVSEQAVSVQAAKELEPKPVPKKPGRGPP